MTTQFYNYSSVNTESRVALSKEGEAILSAISKYGCFTVEQSKYFITHIPSAKPDTHKKICELLSIKQLATLTEPYLLYKDIPAFSQAPIDALWTTMDILGMDEALGTKLLNTLKPAYPFSSVFIKNNRTVCKIISVVTAEDLAKVRLADEAFLATTPTQEEREKASNGTVYFITIREKKMLLELEDMHLSIPHKVALLEGGYLDKPTITYYGN